MLMKRVIRICVFIALLMCSLVFVSCSREQSCKNITVKFQASSQNGEGANTVLFEHNFDEIKVKNGEALTVLKAAELALSESGEAYEIDDSMGHSYISSAFGYAEDYNDETGVFHFWDVTVNDSHLSELDDMANICDNDVIVYIWTESGNHTMD